ncbi:Transcription factor gsfR2 [Fusarium oxysporum f. sp. rapae]|uniref:Transcription factor gsfR2 n=1 Tax=Fusarium oxysporum f. sp. rapae TaxID=485398 RepID=A0A8J5TTJ5_FUSOX|nr:Transcription factor gsfR2 [Fusarium oxysporum f. sp. rapae]
MAGRSDVIVWNDRADTTETTPPNHDSFTLEVGHDISLFPTPITLPPPLVPLIEEITGRGRTMSLFTPDPYSQYPNQSSPNSPTLYTAPTIGASLLPSQGSRNRPVYTNNTFKERAEYAASRLIHQAKTFAETGQTSFIHCSQASSSTALRDAFAACSLYTTRNSVNGSLVASEIARRAELLIKATDTAITLSPPSPHSTMNLDLLPSIQAMLIYQCMRLFSTGDNPQQEQAAQDAKSLNKWIDILQAQTSTDSNRSKFNHCWKDWVRAESIQRTMIFADLLESIYTFLKFGWYQPSPRLAELGFTGRETIWSAKSITEWQQARDQKAWLGVDMSRFRDSVKGASLDALDELGIIILVSYEGVEILKEWAGDDKRLLEKWGLSSRDDFFSWPKRVTILQHR